MSREKFTGYDDETLLLLLMKGDMNAFEAVYHRYWRRLYSMAYKRVGVKEVAEELVQDIFTSLWLNRQRAVVQNLAAYLLKAMKYKVINYLRHEMIKRAYTTQEQGVAVALDNSTEEKVLLDDLQQALDKEIGKLPAGCQTVFKLSRQHHYSMKQVACELGISEKTVENQLSKAVKLLRENLKHFAAHIPFLF